MTRFTDLLARGRAEAARLHAGQEPDRAAQRDLDWTAHGVDLPPGLELTWLGTAGFRLRAEGTTVLIDPYVSRRPLPDLVRRRPLRSRPDLVERLLPEADAVLVGHTHFDHAVDVPALAARGATVYGSRSALRLLGLFGLAARGVSVEPHVPISIGPFTVRFVPSRHSRLVAGRAVPFDGEISCDALDDLGFGAYRCGDVWGIHVEYAGATIYHQGSAEVVEDAYHEGSVDVLLCGISGRRYAERFASRIVSLVDPGVVVPHHHDDFFRPIDGEMGFSLNVRLDRFVDDVAQAARTVPVRTLRPFTPVGAS